MSFLNWLMPHQRLIPLFGGECSKNTNMLLGFAIHFGALVDKKNPTSCPLDNIKVKVVFKGRTPSIVDAKGAG